MVSLGDDLRIEPPVIGFLTIIPRRQVALRVTDHSVRARILTAIREAWRLVDHDRVVKRRLHSLQIPALHTLEKPADELRVSRRHNVVVSVHAVTST
jgi:hypothetical protein